MECVFYVQCAILFLATSIAHADNNILTDMVQQMEIMQRKIEKLEKSENNLVQVVNELVGTTAQLRLEIDELTAARDECRQAKLEMEQKLGQSDNDQRVNEAKEPEPESDVDTKTATAKRESFGDHTKTAKRQSPSVHVAFSAYIDHVMDHMGADQTVIYNQVLLNDNNAYSKFSGIFTAPITGVYLFSMSVTARKLDENSISEAWLKLMVNGIHQVSTVAESLTVRQDEQGSSTVVLRLSKGDLVWVAQILADKTVYGADNERSTSFTGVLLYSEE